LYKVLILGLYKISKSSVINSLRTRIGLDERNEDLDVKFDQLRVLCFIEAFHKGIFKRDIELGEI
jgi:hypothetical protein